MRINYSSLLSRVLCVRFILNQARIKTHCENNSIIARKKTIGGSTIALDGIMAAFKYARVLHENTVERVSWPPLN